MYSKFFPVGEILTAAQFKLIPDEALLWASEQGYAFEIPSYKDIERISVVNAIEELFTGTLSDLGAWPSAEFSKITGENLIMLESCFGFGEEDRIHVKRVRVVKF